MIVGNLNLDYTEIKKFVNHPQDIVAYCDNTIPVWCKHITPIVMNQRYYMAIHIRDMLTLPFKVRSALVETLIKDVTITGVMSHFISIYDVLEACDKEKFTRVLEDFITNEK